MSIANATPPQPPPRLRLARVAILAALSIASGGCGRSSRDDATIARADVPAKSSTKPTASASAVPPPRSCAPPTKLALGAHGTLPIPFDRVAPDGRLRLLAREPSSRPTRVVMLDPTTFAISSSRVLDPHAVWASLDGAIQLVWTPGAWVRLDVATGKQTRIDDAPTAEREVWWGAPGVALSEDGKLAVRGDRELYDVDRASAISTLPYISAGGASPSYGFVADDRFIAGCQRGCAVMSLARARTVDGNDSTAWTSLSDPNLVATDPPLGLSTPSMPFGSDWDPTFSVVDLTTQASRKPFALTIRARPSGAPPPDGIFSAALCPTGESAAIAFAGQLHVVDTLTGNDALVVPLPASMAKGDAPTVRYSPRTRAIALVSGDQLQWMEPQR